MKSLWKAILIISMITVAFSQTKNIGIWGQYADTSRTSRLGEYWRVVSALDSGPFDYILHNYWDYTAITADSLSRIDVFIVPECERGSSFAPLAGAALGSIIRPWVESGGLFIGFFRDGAAFITAAGLDTINGSMTGSMDHNVSVVLPDHPLAEGVDSTFSGMNASYCYPNYSGYTKVVDYSGNIHTGFEEFGAGCAVFFAWDYFDTLTPNQDKLFQNAIVYWGMRSEGPIMGNFYPPEGTIVAGYPAIRMVFQDEEGIDITSFQATINGNLITGYDPSVSASGDTIFVEIPDTMPDGEITIRIRQIEDVLGHAGPDTAHVYSFSLDNTPPTLSYREPEGMLSYTPGGALITYGDAIAGSDSNSWFIFMDGLDTIRNGSAGVIVEDDTLVILSFHPAGITPVPNDTNWIEFGVWDTPDEGEPNMEVYRWWFYPAVDAVAESDLPRESGLTLFPNPFNSAVNISLSAGVGASDARSGQVGIEIYDITGHLVADLPVTNCGSPQFVPTPQIWQPEKSLGSGIYLVRARFDKLSDREKQITKRIVYLK